MVIGVFSIDIYIPQCRSLKEKRKIIKGMKESLRNRYNVSIAEVEHQHLWQRAKLTVVSVSNQKKKVEQIFSSILNFIEGNGHCELSQVKTEFII